MNERDRALTLSRRRLVQAGGGATALAALGGLPRVAIAGPDPDPAYLSRSAYTGHVLETFPSSGGDMVLLAVDDLARAKAEPGFAGREDAFALLFAGPPGLEGAVYSFDHPNIGPVPLFIAPAGPAGDAQAYEAVVDRSVDLGSGPDRVAPAPLEQPEAAPAEPAGPKSKIAQITVARRGGELFADVRVRPGIGIRAVQVLLVRGEVVYARGFRRLRKKHAVRMRLRELLAAKAGEYFADVTVTDRRGRRSTSRHRVGL